MKSTLAQGNVESMTFHRKLCKYNDTICILIENMVYCTNN
ncbi:hypothetical protein HMPREF9470_03898 [[Clostridium] citroniae WAL-19142]|uniref:Uncharacterized protein n=2 Tax=Enterocloster citroniae TaxID=358743 RepID=A0ABV2FV53_9FIRM|nr:hypothetical protein HMPREF9470_03898 [[Clostridium] citroniae WAL-19142]